jgi:hypothetical protein
MRKTDVVIHGRVDLLAAPQPSKPKAVAHPGWAPLVQLCPYIGHATWIGPVTGRKSSALPTEVSIKERAKDGELRRFELPHVDLVRRGQSEPLARGCL